MTDGRAQVRAHLEDVATRLFATDGYAATTVDAIVAAAGVSKPAMYRHFESKKELYLALLRRFRGELADAALSALDPESAPEKLIPEMTDAWFRYVEDHPRASRILLQDFTSDPEIEAVRAEMRRLQREGDMGLLRLLVPNLPEAELEPLGEIIRSSLTGLALWWLDHRDTPRETVVAAMIRTADGLWRGQR
jgi:AcrR family transcriptional regulator